MRHGTPAMHTAGCRCDLCNYAKVRYNKSWRYDQDNGRPRKVPTLGFRRRVEALQAIGYSLDMIAERFGLPRQAIYRICTGAMMLTRTHERMARLYDELSVIPGPSSQAKARARRLGYPVPFAWDDIDDPDEVPKTGTARSKYTNEVLLHEIEHFRWQGYTLEQTAEILGMTKKGLEKAQSRAAA